MTLLHQNIVSEPCPLITNILEDKVIISFWFSPPPGGVGSHPRPLLENRS